MPTDGVRWQDKPVTLERALKARAIAARLARKDRVTYGPFLIRADEIVRELRGEDDLSKLIEESLSD